jgi:hypothetical protein
MKLTLPAIIRTSKKTWKGQTLAYFYQIVGDEEKKVLITMTQGGGEEPQPEVGAVDPVLAGRGRLGGEASDRRLQI